MLNELRGGKSSDALVRRLKVYVAQLVKDRVLQVDVSRVAGHSLRRTGANAFRDACRTAGMDDATIERLLMALCRWVSEKSVKTYLVQHYGIIARAMTASRC